jgi:UDPglucose 6-dehydrogenase
MKVGVIGAGYVGSAVARSHRHDDVVIRDPALGTDSATLTDVAQCDVIYVCLPSPSRLDGGCDTVYLEHGLAELMQHSGMDQRPIIAKTTAPPDTYRALHQRWPNIVHVPEFLTAVDHLQSYANSGYFVLGGSDPWRTQARDVLQTVFSLLPHCWMFTDIATAALYKYMMNSYLATKVTFFNEFYRLSQALGVDFVTLTSLAREDRRIGTSHMQVPGPDGEFGWGGACFPKDIAALIHFSRELDQNAELLSCVQNLNQQHRNSK